MKKYSSIIFVAVLIALIPAVSAETSASASRNIEIQNLDPGGSTNVTVTIINNVSQALSLMETIPFGWTLTRVSDDASAFKPSTNEWTWFNVGAGVTKAVIYILDVPSNASPGIYHINGNITNASGIIASVSGDNFINVSETTSTPTATITGMKFNDSNGDGIKDAGEPGLANWQINLTKPDGTTTSKNTDASGNYNFTNLAPGTYTVSETQQAGWTQTAPKTGTYNVTIIGGSIITGKDFGNSQNVVTPPTGANVYNVTGFKLNSSDTTGLQGWVINISNDTINMQATTDVNGLYMFSGLSNGTYNITENPMTDWTNVSPSTIEVTVNGADLPNQNFTNMPNVPVIQPYVVSGFILNSSDTTGLQGWVINISNDTINMQATADVNGLYMFSGLSNGTYNITENPMTDWTNVSPSTIEVTVNGADLPNQNFTNILTAQPPVNAEVAYIVIVPYSVSLHTGEELQFHAQAYDANDTKIDANISYVIKNNQSNVGTITESGLFSALKSGSVRITASSGDISDTAVVTVTNIDHRNRHGNRHHNSGGWQEYIGAVN
jgi:hypothetical protein